MAYDDSLNIDARIDQTGVESGMNDMAENVRRGMDAVSVAAGNVLADLAGKVKDTFADMLKSGDEYNKAMNQLAASTGATGEELEELKEVSKDVFSHNYGESYEDVANAVANVKKQLGDLPNDELQAITESAFALSDVFEYDVAESTRAAKAMVDNFGISGEYAMELIAAGAQNGLDYSGELIDSISEYSVQFAKVGLDADDMFAIFQQGAENGAWNLDKVGDAVKEFSIRAIDGSDTTAEGFAAIGLNADEMAWKFTQGGDTAKSAFQQTIASLTSMEDPIARDAAGVALFGTMLEDLGVEAIAAMGEIQGGAYATGDAMNSIKEVKYNDIGSAIEGLKRSIGSFTIDARAAFSSKIAGAIGTLVNALNSADGDISVIFEGIVNAAKQAGSAFGGLIGGWAENGKKIIGYLIDGIQKNMPEIQEKAGEILQFLVNGFLNGKKRMLEVAVPLITGIVQGIAGKLPEIVSSGAEILQNIVTGIVDAIPQLLPLAVTVITSLVDGLSQAIVAILGFAPVIISTLISGIVGVLPTLISCAVEILNALISAITTNLPLIISTAVEIVMELINGIVSAIPQLLPVAIDIIKALADGVTKMDTMIYKVAPEILTTLISGIIGALPTLIECAVEILNAFISAITTNLPLIISAAIEMIVSLVAGIIGSLPMLIDAAMQILNTLISTVVENLPLIINAAVQILTALLNGIISNLPMLIGAAIGVLNALISTIIGNLPLIISAAIEILIALLNGIIENLPVLIEAAIGIITMLISTIVENLPLIISAAIELLIALLNGIIENLPMLIDAAIQILTALMNSLIENLPMLIDAAIQIVTQLFSGIIANLPQLLDAGIKLITELIKGLVEAIPDIINAIPQIVSAIWDTLEETDWIQLGKDLLRGIADGLLEGMSSIWDTVTEVCDELWNGFKDFFGIHSPSKLMREEIGQWLLPGVAVGVEDTSSETADEINGSLKSLSNQLEMPEIESPKQSEIDVKSPKINISEPEPLKFESTEIDAQKPEPSELSAINQETQMFTQQVEILRNFTPVNDIPQLDDERITAEIQSQLDELMVTLNADDFISRFENILANFGNNAVPQYSAVYGQAQSVPEKRENNHFELPKSTQNSQKINIYIGDTEIKDFVISAIDEANAVSGGVTV